MAKKKNGPVNQKDEKQIRETTNPKSTVTEKIEPKSPVTRKTPLFTAALEVLAPLLSSDSIASLSKSRVAALAKKTALSLSDLTALVATHKLAATTGLPADILFALAKSGGPLDRANLVAANPRELRKKIESAVKNNFVSAETLAAFDAVLPTLARLQTSDASLKTLNDTYKLKIPTNLLEKLEGRGFKSLADLRSAGNLSDLAKKLNLKPDDARLATLTTHANLSFLGSDVPTNSVLIENGYKSFSGVAREPEGMFIDKVGAAIGFAEALRIQRTATAQMAVMDNHLSGILSDRANGYALAPTHQKIADSLDNLHPPKCECKDCEAAVSPLAYLADLIGYTTTNLGTAKPNVVPLYRLVRVNPPALDHFYTQSAVERDLAVANSGYQYEGIACYVFSTQVDQTFPLYRLYHPGFGDHFYTTDPTERSNAVSQLGYHNEGTAGFVYTFHHGTESVPLYRLLNDTTHDHFYTIDPDERQKAIDQAGYHKETGIDKAGEPPKEGYDRLTPHRLSELFYQPFSDLPLSCDQEDERVRQVRICIEVLRSYVSGKKIGDAKVLQNLQLAFESSEAKYRRQTYQALLLKLGTSFTDLRAARGATTEGRQTLADRLSIPSGDQQRDYLNELLLDLDTASEVDIERLFGLADTRRDPLSHGAKLKDDKSQLRRWNFNDVSWGVNTDRDGILYVRLSSAPGKTRVQVYNSSGLTSATLEASGEVDPSLSTIALSSVKDANGRSNGLSGEVEVKIDPNGGTIAIQVVPQIVSWRLQKLRTQWEDQDSIKDAYSTFAKNEDRLPVIDPDVIGPDDFRDLDGAAFTKLWKPRRVWVDGLLKDIALIVFPAGSTPAPDAFSKLFKEMVETTYGPTTKSFWPSNAADLLQGLVKDLSDKTDADKLNIAIADLWARFKLTPEMLLRLITLNNKHDDWVYDVGSNPPLEPDEWEEVYNLLVQAHKFAWYSEWVLEEGKKLLTFGPKSFWISLREPKEDSWPPAELPNNVPRIDPETMKLDELPDETTGQEAIDLWTQRQDDLRQYAETLAAKNRDLAGATSRITTSLGVAMNDLWQNYDLLLSQTPADVTQGTDYVEHTLEWSIEAFMKVMGLRAKLLANQTPQPAKPSDSEWSEAARLLVTAYKQRVMWTTWATEESKLEDWDMVKVSLPRWRGSLEVRQGWQRGLLNRSSAPLIDPDLLRETHFRQRRENPALDLWRSRSDKLNKSPGILEGFRQGSTNRAGLESRIKEALGPFKTPGRLATVLDSALDGSISMARLDQLNLNREALNFLARMHTLLAQSTPQKVTNEEWDDIAAILTQVWKSRQSAEWRLEEEQKNTTLSPDWFKIPSLAGTTQFPAPKPADPPRWRGVRSDVLDWEDRLQSRLDQEQAVIDGVREAVNEVEEITLPLLRDALVIRSYVPAKGLSEQADWITEHLLIDAKQSGCQKTSRVAQAIETIQQLLWSVRTGLLADAYPDLKLLPVHMRDDIAIDTFDESWKWIGFYPMWRAAMFVFLYPENILAPSLKGHQSPAFLQLVGDLRGLNRIVASRFISAIKRYYGYFNDICGLNLEACFDTLSNVWEETEGVDLYPSASARLVSFLFATTQKGDLYWSVWDRSNPDWGQSYWRRLNGFKNDISNLIGCTVYKTPANRRLLYLFAKTNKDGAETLEFLRLDLESGEWDSESEEISLPTNATDASSFTVALQPTPEAAIPAMFITFPDATRYRITLGRKGGREDGKAQPLGTPDTWTSRNGLSASFGKVQYSPSTADHNRYTVSGTSISVVSMSGTQKALAHWVQVIRAENELPPASNTPWRLVGDVSNGSISWSTTPAVMSPLPVDSWPMGSAVCDIKRDGANTPDMITAYLKWAGPNSDYKIYYKIGWDLKANGSPTTESAEFDSGMSFPYGSAPIVGSVDNASGSGTDVTADGMKIAVTTSPDGQRLFLVAIAICNENPFRRPNFVGTFLNTYAMRVKEVTNNGNVINPTKIVTPPSSSMGADYVPTGVGLAFTSLRSNDQLDAVVFYLMRPNTGGECIGEYFIGKNLDLNTFIPESGSWSEAQEVGGGDKWFGALTTGGAITIADVNNNGRSDLVVFHNAYGGGKDTVDGYYRIGFDLGFEKSVLPTACNGDGIKPISLPVMHDLSGLQPPRLMPGDFTATKHRRNFVYLEEAYYFAPVLAALQLQKGGEYVAALDWLRLVYDYTLPPQQRALIGMAPGQYLGSDYQRDNPNIKGDEYDWLLDPLNPHAIARTRRNAYLRFTLLSVIKCLLDYADSEFTQDTGETVPRARELYMTALQLLYDNELKPVSETCEGVLQDLLITFGEKWADYIPELIPNLDNKVGDVKHIKDGLQQVFDRYQDTDILIQKAREFIDNYTKAPETIPRLGFALDQLPAQIQNVYTAGVAERPLADLLGATVPPGYPAQSSSSLDPRTLRTMSTTFGMTETARAGDQGLAELRDGVITPARDYGVKNNLGTKDTGSTNAHGGWVVVSQLFCVPHNPILRMLRLRANLNLYKIRTCRNISGLKRELDLYAAPTDTQTGMPAIGAGGQLVLPGTARIQPTPYRFQVLINRAKQLVQNAMQIEQAFLSALEKSDAEAYALLKARQDLRLTKAGVTLQALRVTEAQGGVRLATLQRDRATIQIKTYTKWMSAGLSDLEKAIIGQYIGLGISEALIGVLETPIQVAATQTAAAYLSASGVALAAARAVQAGLSASIKVSEIFASQERRMEEWELQKGLAEQDQAIGDQQIDLAEDHVRVTEQERTIAQMQADNAQEGVDFLSGKFTNKDLYDWMSGILERVYSFFLQQATGVAQLAQSQLAFERQEAPPNYIQPDYWDGPPDGNSTDTQAPDRRGLTGSARLLQDIYQLDQYAFDNDKRKLQLTKTISLAQLDPFGFQQFRETGILSFTTPMELFDRDFPGHYLRLIKRVRTSVIALIPPSQGIRATLSSTGLSRVVIGGDIFQRINLRQDPETVALSSPINATGLFDLEQQSSSDMLLPFEGTGVDTPWEFRMLKASNQCDFDAIADVFLTIDYTALNSFDYQQQVIQSPALSRPLSADRPFSFRYQFADSWYDLHNPDQSDDAMFVTFETLRADFPVNLSNLRIQHVVLYVASTTDKIIELESVELRFTEQGGGTVGGVASTNEGLVSTRKGNAGPWNSMIGKSPVGQWTMRLQDRAAVRQFFDQKQTNPQKPTERVADILLVITYSGRTPEWPL